MSHGWRAVRLDECCEIVSGATPDTSVEEYWNGDICWATPKDLSDLDDSVIASTPRRLTHAGLASCAAEVLPAGSVLFSSRAPIGHVAINSVPMATNQGFKSFVPKPGVIDAKFLYWWLRANRAYLESLGNGATFKEVSKAIVSRVQIPLPSLESQRRIAEVLDRADALRAKRRSALALLGELQESVFADLIGDPGTNPRRWPVAPVSDFVLAFQGGKSLEAESGEGVVTPYRVLKISAVTSMTFRPDESKPVPPSYEPPVDHLVRDGDLLFSRANTSELVGAVAYVHAAPPNLLLPDKLWRFVWRDPTTVEPLFVWALFQSAAVRREIGRRATGTSGSMKNISQEKLFGISVIIPPLDTQREFARRLRILERIKSRHLAATAELDGLLAALEHRAFRGEL